MLHVYNFQAAAAAPTPTPAVSLLPNASMEAPGSSGPLPLLVALAASVFVTSGALVLRRRATRIG